MIQNAAVKEKKIYRRIKEKAVDKTIDGFQFYLADVSDYHMRVKNYECADQSSCVSCCVCSKLHTKINEQDQIHGPRQGPQTEKGTKHRVLQKSGHPWSSCGNCREILKIKNQHDWDILRVKCKTYIG